MAGPALPPRRRLEYEVTDRDYNIEELIDKFEESIPFTVVVSKGYGNKSLPYTGLQEKQVYRVQCVSRNERILARLKRRDAPSIYYSIPVNYYINMALVDGQGNEKGNSLPLHYLLHQNVLPFRARFKTDTFAEMAGKALFTSHILPLNMIARFDEIHLLLNRIPNISEYGTIDTDILYIPQFYDKIRFKKMTGLKGIPKPEIKRMERNIDGVSASLEFDMQYCQTEIAEYRPHKYKNDLVYTNMEPLRAGKLSDLFPKPLPSLPTDLYEQLSDAREEPVYYSIDTDTCGNKPSVTYTSRDNTNDIPRGQVQPMKTIHTALGSVPRIYQSATGSKLTKSQSEQSLNVCLPIANSVKNIKKLSVDGVASYLHKLKLGRYASSFKDQLIDGVILSDLDKDILVEELGFRSVDAIKLMHFIKDCHIPR